MGVGRARAGGWVRRDAREQMDMQEPLRESSGGGRGAKARKLFRRMQSLRRFFRREAGRLADMSYAAAGPRYACCCPPRAARCEGAFSKKEERGDIKTKYEKV